MADRDTALALVQGVIALAGLVLVYSGLLATKSESFAGSRRGDKYAFASRLGLVPVLSALFCGGMGARVLNASGWGSDFCASWLIVSFEVVLAITAIYAIVAALLNAR
jgi:hypothetical protein